MKDSNDQEFPLLSALGLYASNILGDGKSTFHIFLPLQYIKCSRATLQGNCLFNALSDQLYGSQTEHHAIRAKVIDYMRTHAEYYKQFIDAHPGGGIRRNPKRKNAGAYSSPANYASPSDADIDRVFEGHLECMARGGTYGDNMEITAFSSAFNVDVKIYQRDFAYMVTGGGDGVERPVAHIAYHTWEHYSSIRNLEGPHTGPPEVSAKVLSFEQEQTQREKLAQTPMVMPWQVDVVSKSLPYLADKPTIKRALEAARGDVNAAVDSLLDAESNGSSSQQESSSVERDHDSDDDMHDQPNKKQNRRMSKTSKVHQAQRARSTEAKHALSQITAYDGSQESIGSFDSESSSVPDTSYRSTITKPASDDDDNINVKIQDSTSRSASPATRPPIRLKLHPPRPPHQQRAGKTQQSQLGPRQSARDRKDMQKRAQKAAHKVRQQQATAGSANESPSDAGLAFRQKGLTGTPPVETLKTLYI